MFGNYALDLLQAYEWREEGFITTFQTLLQVEGTCGRTIADRLAVLKLSPDRWRFGTLATFSFDTSDVGLPAGLSQPNNRREGLAHGRSLYMRLEWLLLCMQGFR